MLVQKKKKTSKAKKSIGGRKKGFKKSSGKKKKSKAPVISRRKITTLMLREEVSKKNFHIFENSISELGNIDFKFQSALSEDFFEERISKMVSLTVTFDIRIHNYFNIFFSIRLHLLSTIYQMKKQTLYLQEL